MPASGRKQTPKTARARKPAGSRAKRGGVTIADDFYGSALKAAEQIELKEAAGVEGLDEEIAVLRLKLRGALAERPDDLALMLRGIDLLVKAVSAHYRLSKEAEDDLAGNLAGLLNGVGGQLMPELFAPAGVEAEDAAPEGLAHE